jgi:hypothetical protein
MRSSLTLLLAGLGLALGVGLAIRNPTKNGEFWYEEQARARCPSDTVVWVNTLSHVYHFPGTSSHGHSYYGHTKEGAYMCEADAKAAGNRPALDERHP